jgi:hypothetical protein
MSAQLKMSYLPTSTDIPSVTSLPESESGHTPCAKPDGQSDRPVWTGSCPCQPFSAAGKSGGFDDERHLWPAFHYLISQCRPNVVFGEQVASKDGLAWLDLVQADLEGTGYAVGAVDTCAAGFGAPAHQTATLPGSGDSQSDGQQQMAAGRWMGLCRKWRGASCQT